ncbi:MAG TPA: BadF/BadG/BcrA/BcrD ATPase family protein [Ktedonobacterales bacterium]|nr:BadF/BadG/BcrA/BcrD ATPase family protein [Ktedonobacterales bacterium]
MHCVLGIDGGNTKTLALVAALDGTILGFGRAGCGDIYNAQPTPTSPDSASAAVANIAQAVMSALDMAQAQPSDLLAGVFNMAGADWPEDFALLRAAMEEHGFGKRIVVQNDALGVLHAGVSSAIGVSLICGSGAAIGARGPDGRTWHTSHWQDDIQGSHHLAQKTLVAVYRSELGIEPPTTLTARVLDFFHLDSVEALLHLFTSRAREAPDHVGRLTPILLDEAEAGDHVARRIVQEHGRALGDYVLAAARRVGLDGQAFLLVLAGGIFHHPSALLAEAIIDHVQQTAPLVSAARCRFEPVIGVLFAALEAAGVTVDEAPMAKLLPTIPPASFFTTAGEIDTA